MNNLRFLIFVCSAPLVLSGCASSYGNRVDNTGLGAAQYQPAVYVPAENRVKYEEVLTVCRQVAANRQVTSAQKAQLQTLTGALEGAIGGAAGAASFAAFIDQFDDDVDVGDAAGVGLAAGLIGSLVSSFAQGSHKVADETRKILLNCLKQTSDKGRLWKVLEDVNEPRRRSG